LLGTQFILVVLLFGVETSTLKLSVFEFLDTGLLTLQPLCIHSVRPIADASFGSILKALPLVVPQSLIRVGLGLDDLSANTVKLIHRDDCGALRLHSVAGSHGINTTRVSRRWRLHGSTSSG